MTGPGFDVETETLVRLARHLCEEVSPRVRGAANALREPARIPASAWGHVEFLDLEAVGMAYDDARQNTVRQLDDVAEHLCQG